MLQSKPLAASILINDSNLREIGLHKFLKRTAFTEQPLVVHETSWSPSSASPQIFWISKNLEQKTHFANHQKAYTIQLTHPIKGKILVNSPSEQFSVKKNFPESN